MAEGPAKSDGQAIDALRRQLEGARAERDEARARETALADILRVISQSPTNDQPVLDAIAASAVRLGKGLHCVVYRYDGALQRLAAEYGVEQATLAALHAIYPSPPRPTAATGYALINGKAVHVADIRADGRFDSSVAVEAGYRAALAVPMMTDTGPVGVIFVVRREPVPFSDAQVELLEAFAAQAVIAFENVRLLNELRQRTSDLQEALDQQTASAEILQAISRSPTNVQPVLEAVARATVRFCGAPDAVVALCEGDEIVVKAHEGILTASMGLRQPARGNSFGARVIEAGRTQQIADVTTLDPIEYAKTWRLAQEHHWRATAAAPMLREGKAVGLIILRKPEPGLLSQRQVSLLEGFAAHAAIAIENVRLFSELRDSLERLKAAQANLVQSEKMASLGQLTAGIAHEIKNPLNFVNNFAALSVELLDELRETAAPGLAALDEDRRAEVDETIELLVGNLGKIVEHGRRADGIVRSMLSHSRGGSGDWTPSDINALVEEALNLAYHGARAQDRDFNATLERDFEMSSKPIEVVPQDVMRVFLNLFGNGLYAANQRRLRAKEAGFKPTLRVSTRDLGEAVEIRVRDNGTGIAPEVRDKLFQPFFTTKPTGEGTGLGLSISYDIVKQQHGGTIEVESEPDTFTEFTVRLPRTRRVVAASGDERR